MGIADVYLETDRAKDAKPVLDKIEKRIQRDQIEEKIIFLKLRSNYLCIDSDSIFIRDFGKTDFLASDGEPYTVLHQNKELFQLTNN